MNFISKLEIPILSIINIKVLIKITQDEITGKESS